MELETEETRLQRLRDENAKRWSELVDLHNQVVSSLPTNNDVNPTVSLLRRLQVEVDLVPHNGVYDECDKMMDQFASSDCDNSLVSSLLIPDVVQSTRNVMEAGVVLAEALDLEREKLDEQQRAIAEQKEIQERLQQLLEESNVPMACEEGAASANVDHPDTEQELHRQLKDDLQYVSKCIVKRKAKGARVPDDQMRNLGDVIGMLIDKSFTASVPEDSYIAIEDEAVSDEVVQVMQQCFMVESFKDDDTLIKLIDYRP